MSEQDLHLFKQIARLRYTRDSHSPEYRQRQGEEFDDFIAQLEAAAEQRGAIKALRHVAGVMQDDLAWANTQRGLLVFEDESDPGISPFQWLEHRANHIEGTASDEND